MWAHIGEPERRDRRVRLETRQSKWREGVCVGWGGRGDRPSLSLSLSLSDVILSLISTMTTSADLFEIGSRRQRMLSE